VIFILIRRPPDHRVAGPSGNRKKKYVAERFVAEFRAAKGAKTVVRLNPKEEQRRREKEEKAARKPAVVAKYSEWNAGVTTVKQKEQAAAEFLHEARKLLARYADDTDLEATLRVGGHAEGAKAGQRLHVGVREEEEGQEVQG
jgi:hypothetical protein